MALGNIPGGGAFARPRAQRFTKDNGSKGPFASAARIVYGFLGEGQGLAPAPGPDSGRGEGLILGPERSWSRFWAGGRPAAASAAGNPLFFPLPFPLRQGPPASRLVATVFRVKTKKM